MRSRKSPSSAPTSSPRSIRQPCASGHRDGAPVRVGVVGDHEVGADLGGERHREVHRARLLRVRERDGREVRVGLGLRAVATCGAAKPARSITGRHGLAADAVQRRVDACQLPRAVRVDQGDRRRRGRPRATSSPSRVPAVAARRTPAERADRVDRGGDLGVGGRDDLAAVAQVDLVAVVLRRVVRRGHHHAGDAAERAGSRRRAPASAAGGGAARRRRPAPTITAAVSSAKTSELCRASYPTTTVPPACALLDAGTPRGRPRPGSPRPGSSGSGRRRARRAGRRCRTRAARRSASASGRRPSCAARGRPRPARRASSSSARVCGSGSSAAQARARSRRSLMRPLQPRSSAGRWNASVANGPPDVRGLGLVAGVAGSTRPAYCSASSCGW